MWVSLISQTGSEVAAIQNKLGIKPDYIFRDREDGEINPKIKNQVKIMLLWSRYKTGRML